MGTKEGRNHPDEDEIEIEDLIEVEENVVTLTHFGYIKDFRPALTRAKKEAEKV